MSATLPKIHRHRASNRARVKIDGRHVYLGPWGSPEAKREYERLMSEYLASGRTLATPAAQVSRTVSQMILAYLEFAEGYYKSPEVATMKAALKPLHRLYGSTPAAAFSPLKLKALREKVIAEPQGAAEPWSRTYTNAQVNRIRRVFKWAAENELVPAAVYHALATVAPLKAGRTAARETQPVAAVDEAHVAATLQHLPPTVQAMVRVEALTGMRPGEVCRMRGCDLDMTGPVWLYVPPQHKNAWRGHRRQVAIGPKAQAILEPFLKADLQAYLFSPRQADAERRAARRQARRTPAGQGNASGTNRRRRPRRQPGDCYTTATYRRAIEYAVELAFAMPEDCRTISADYPGPGATAAERRALEQRRKEKAAKRRVWHAEHSWTPNQLRHFWAERGRLAGDLDAVQEQLGHKDQRTTQRYARPRGTKGEALILRIG